MTQERYLWQYVEPADELSARLAQAVKDKTDNLPELAAEAAKRLLTQQDQMAGIINLLLQQQGAIKVVELLSRAGFSRHELVSCWEVPPELAIHGELQKDRPLRSAD